MYFENLLPPANIRQWHDNLTIKTTWTKQGRVKHVRTIGRRDDNDALLRIKTVHFHEQRIQGLLTLVVTAAETVPADTARPLPTITAPWVVVVAAGNLAAGRVPVPRSAADPEVATVERPVIVLAVWVPVWLALWMA